MVYSERACALISGNTLRVPGPHPPRTILHRDQHPPTKPADNSWNKKGRIHVLPERSSFQVTYEINSTPSLSSSCGLFPVVNCSSSCHLHPVSLGKLPSYYILIIALSNFISKMKSTFSVDFNWADNMFWHCRGDKNAQTYRSLHFSHLIFIYVVSPEIIKEIQFCKIYGKNGH